MQHKYDIYRPTPTLRDVYDVSRSYYRAHDLSVTPQMTIGSLTGLGAKDGKSTTSNLHLSATSPLFTKNFKLIKPKSYSSTHKVAVRQPKRVSKPLNSMPAQSKLVASTMLAAAWAALTKRIRQVDLFPKKYAVDRGVYRYYSTKTFKLAEYGSPVLAALSLVVVLLFAFTSPGGVIERSGESQPASLQANRSAQTNANTQTNPSEQPAPAQVAPSSTGQTYWPKASAVVSTPPNSTPISSVTEPVTSITDPVLPTVVTPPIPDDTGGVGGDTTNPLPVDIPPVTNLISYILPSVTTPLGL